VVIDPFVKVVEPRLLWVKVSAMALTIPEASELLIEDTVLFCDLVLDIRVGAG
jgi:hypothetical protein